MKGEAMNNQSKERTMRSWKRMMTVAVGAAALMATSGGASIASASSTLTNANSPGMAGFVAPLPTSDTGSAGFTFRVPTLTCGTTQDRVDVEAAVYAGTGVLDEAAGVAIECDNGAATYGGELVNRGSEVSTSFTPKAGDKIVLSASTTYDTQLAASIDDVTQGQSQQVSYPAWLASGSLAVGALNLFGFPVPNFGTMRFNLGTLNGTSVGSAVGVTEYNMKSGSVLQIRTGKLNTTGTSWEEVFKHS
jgi:Peptidase A4 family